MLLLSGLKFVQGHYEAQQRITRRLQRLENAVAVLVDRLHKAGHGINRGERLKPQFRMKRKTIQATVINLHGFNHSLSQERLVSALLEETRRPRASGEVAKQLRTLL